MAILVKGAIISCYLCRIFLILGGQIIKAFLFGYYGMNNYGDELLLKSALKFFKDSGVDEILLLYPKSGSRKIGGIKIVHVNRNSIAAIISAVKKADLVIGAGGNVFQDETSKRSFIYYYFLVRFSLIMKKQVVLLGHGIGKINYKCDYKRMRKILSDKNAFGVFRDQISYRYSIKFSSNHLRGSDLAYGFLKNRERLKPVEGRLGVIIKSEWPELEDLIEPFKSEGITEVFLIVTMPEQELKYTEPMQKILGAHFDVSIKIGEVNDLTDAISSCSLILTERLHGAIVASFFGIPFLTRDNFKTKAFFYDFKEYDSFFKDKGPSEIGKALGNMRRYDFEKANRVFVDKNVLMYEYTITWFKNIIDILKIQKGG